MSHQKMIGWMLAAVFAGEMQAQTLSASEAVLGSRHTLPAESAIQREMQQGERQRQALFGVPPSATKQAASRFPHIPTPPRAGIDLDAIARQYAQTATPHKRNTLMLFASFTMPKASLKRLLRQAHRVGAPVLLRGFKNHSFKQTALAIKALGEPNGQVLIHPEAFTQYHIRAVPTLVLTQDSPIDLMNDTARALSGHFVSLSFVSLSGDVSLDYALDEIARRAPEFGPEAVRSLQRLREKPQ